MEFFTLWGCIPEITSNCSDMTNSSSTYLGIFAGVVIGGIISWWIYNRQKQNSEKQDDILQKIKSLEEHNQILLNNIFQLEKKIDKILEG